MEGLTGRQSGRERERDRQRHREKERLRRTERERRKKIKVEWYIFHWNLTNVLTSILSK